VEATAVIARRYEEALEACLKGGENTSLNPAYELGRSALEAGFGVLDLVSLHFETLGAIVAANAGPVPELMWPAQRAFLMEALAPFEMVHRGFIEANQALQEANAELDRRVKERTTELEKAVAALREALEREHASREALERSEARARRLFDSTLIGVFESDEERVLDANNAFLNLLGRTREDLRQGKIRRNHITPPEWTEREDAAIEELKAFGETAPYEKQYFTSEGSRVPVLVGRALLTRSPFHQVCFVLDMTEQKRAQAEVERVRNEFLGVISHELKTPLTVIKGSAAMALSTRSFPDRDQAMELFQVIDDQAERLRELVRNLLDLTRIEAGALSVSPQEENLREVIDEAMATFDKTGEMHRVQLHIGRGLPPILVDRRRIVQVLLNLLTNASKYSPPMAPIKLTARVDRGELLVRVEDSGMGIPPDKLPLLFQKFTQLHAGGDHGTGLGLAISKGIVEAHGGRIWAESEGAGKGATFSFALPVAVGAPARPAADSPAPAQQAPARKRRVLVIDDSPEVLRFVHHCLTSDGYEALLTGEPAEVKKLIKTKKPDVVLLDLRLPGVFGVDLLSDIRGYSAVPVIFLSADEQNAAVERAMREVPAVDSLAKPFTPDELIAKITRALDAGAASN
jgi:PAS domain S-box-containing protein